MTDQTIEVTDILSSEVEDGEITVTLGDSVKDEGIGRTQMMGMDGFISRPNSPDADGCAQALFIYDANTKRIVSTWDNRYADKVGEMQPGDRAIFTDGEARVFLHQERDGVVLFTKSAPDGGGTMMVDLDGKAGAIMIACGNSWIRLDNDGIKLCGGGEAVLTLNSAGAQIDGAYLAANVGGGNLGIMPGLIPPVQGGNSILVGPAGMAGAPSAKWTITIA
jgi:hypothetical protein